MGESDRGSIVVRDAGRFTASAIILDADREYAEIIRDTLRRSGEDVRITTSGSEALEWLRHEARALLVVDYEATAPASQTGRPPASAAPSTEAGPEAFIRIVRHLQPSIGVMVTVPSGLLSAQRVACFNAGADQVVEKPFHPGEFLARARSLVSRVQRQEAARQERARTQQDERATSGSRLEIGDGGARYNGRALDLTATEWVLLRELHEADGWVLSYETLNARVFGTSGEAGAARLKSHISALRQKLRAAGAAADLVRNARSIGYVLVDRDAPGEPRRDRGRWTVHVGGRA